MFPSEIPLAETEFRAHLPGVGPENWSRVVARRAADGSWRLTMNDGTRVHGPKKKPF